MAKKTFVKTRKSTRITITFYVLKILSSRILVHWLFIILENFAEGNSRKLQWKPHEHCNLVCLGIFNFNTDRQWLYNTISLLLLHLVGLSEVKRGIPSHILVIKNNTFMTSIYRKKTFTGFYTKWDSFTPDRKSTKYETSSPNQTMCKFNMFIAAVCFLFDQREFTFWWSKQTRFILKLDRNTAYVYYFSNGDLSRG